MGGAPRLTIIETTRAMYDWAKVHDCMWAFDREVSLPTEIVPWRGDLYNRLIEGQYMGDLDDRWGELPPEPEVEIIEVNLDELLDMLQDLLGDVLKEIPIPESIDELLPDDPPSDLPVLDEDVIEVIIGDDGTTIIRDADGNLIEVIDPTIQDQDPFGIPGMDYEHLLTTNN